MQCKLIISVAFVAMSGFAIASPTPLAPSCDPKVQCCKPPSRRELDGRDANLMVRC